MLIKYSQGPNASVASSWLFDESLLSSTWRIVIELKILRGFKFQSQPKLITYLLVKILLPTWATSLVKYTFEGRSRMDSLSTVNQSAHAMKDFHNLHQLCLDCLV